MGRPYTKHIDDPIIAELTRAIDAMAIELKRLRTKRRNLAFALDPNYLDRHRRANRRYYVKKFGANLKDRRTWYKGEIAEKITRLYNEGLSLREVSEVMHCSKGRILSVLKALGVPRRPGQWTFGKKRGYHGRTYDEVAEAAE